MQRQLINYIFEINHSDILFEAIILQKNHTEK